MIEYLAELILEYSEYMIGFGIGVILTAIFALWDKYELIKQLEEQKQQ